MADDRANISEQDLDFDDQSQSPQISFEVIWRETSLLVKILVPLAIAAVIVTAAFLGGTVALVGMFVAFMLMAFISLPLWLACMEEDYEEHEHPGEPHGIS